VLDAQFTVVQTYVGGQLVYSRDHEGEIADFRLKIED